MNRPKMLSSSDTGQQVELLQKITNLMRAFLVFMIVTTLMFVGVLVATIVIGARLKDDEDFMMTRMRFYTRLAPRLLAQTARTDHESVALDYADPSVVTASGERRTRLDRINALMDAVDAEQSMALTDDEKLMLEMLVSDFLRAHLIMERSHSIVTTADQLLSNASTLLAKHDLDVALGDVSQLMESIGRLSVELLNYTRGLADGTESLKLRFKK